MTLLCWVSKERIFLLIGCVVALLSGLFADRLELSGVFFVTFLGFFTYGLSKIKWNFWVRVIFFVFFIFTSYLLMAHLAPGFNNIKFYDQARFSDLSTPFNMYLNMDKPFIGIFLLIFLNIKRMKSINEIKKLLKSVPAITVLLVLLLLPLALSMGYVKFDPKFPQGAWVWILNNLLVVCVAEEVLFRGLFQDKMTIFFSKKLKQGWVVSIILSSILFGLAHFKGGIPYMVLSAFAGIFYGYAFHSNQKVEASILIHFSLNLIHFIFFTYPSLSATI